MYESFSYLDHRVYDSDIGKSIYEFNNVYSLLANSNLKLSTEESTVKIY